MRVRQKSINLNQFTIGFMIFICQIAGKIANHNYQDKKNKMRTIASVILLLTLVALSSSLRVGNSHLQYKYKVQSSTLDPSITDNIQFFISRDTFGFKGCNLNRANIYQIEDLVSFWDWWATKSYCEQDNDSKIVDLIKKADKVTRDDNTFQLFNQQGEELIKFVKVA